MSATCLLIGALFHFDIVSGIPHAVGSPTDTAHAHAPALEGDLEPQTVSALLEKVQRKGKGGRAPAEDPRLDPSIDPRKARRILANRISAARSKLKQKLILEGLKVRRAGGRGRALNFLRTHERKYN